MCGINMDVKGKTNKKMVEKNSNLTISHRRRCRRNERGINQRGIYNRGIFYTMDALLASFLILMAILLIYAAYTPEESPIEQKTYISQDILTSLSELKIYELNNTFVNAEIANGNITDINQSVIDQVGQYWALNQSLKAQILLESVLNGSLPKGQSVLVTINSTSFSLQNYSGIKDSSTSMRMISGIAEGKPLTGSSGSSYLRKIHNKKTSAYSYFGGFFGEGNITTRLMLPQDFNSSRLVSAELKIETPGTFKLYINNQQCGASYSGMNGTVYLWNMTLCSGLSAGRNNISLRYTSSLNTSYVAGGFFKVVYETDTLKEDTPYGYARYYFPNIEGFINFYDTVFAQGNIQNWTLNVTFYNPYQTFFTFGNETIFITQGNSTANQTMIYSRINQNMLQEPIPIRIAVTNFSNISTVASGLPADIFMTTDVSGSMGDCIGNALACSYQYRKTSGGSYIPISCVVYDANACNADPDNPCGGSPFNRGRNYNTVCNQSMLDVAKVADNLLVYNVTTTSSLHKMGLVDYSTSAHTLTPLTNNAATLYSEIGTYTASGSTCTCCALNMARDNVINSTNNRFIILLSDGEPNICCRGFHDYTGTGDSSGCSGGGVSPINWTIVAGQEACKNNITVYTIGFGPDMSASGQDTMKKTACNSSLYYNATNTSQLPAIFKNITKNIFLSANFSSQTVTVVGNFTRSTLYDTSYIDMYYNPVTEEPEQNKISLVAESAQFNGCNASIFIPSNVDVQDAYVTSYSGSHWTKQVRVNGVYIFNLSRYGSDYALLGDPFIIQVPSVALASGAYNNISITVGDNPINSSTCSGNNTLIYMMLINVSTSRTDAMEKAVGCNWSMELSTGAMINMVIPKEYVGAKTCRYTSTNISYDALDVYDVSVYNMLRQLDYSNSGTLFVDISQNDLEIVLITTGQIAYMWGPSLMRVEVWQ